MWSRPASLFGRQRYRLTLRERRNMPRRSSGGGGGGLGGAVVAALAAMHS
jgi:hypothetical protein